MNGIVNLSSYTLTNAEISVLSKGWVFAPLQGHQILEILSVVWMFLKELDYNYFSASNQDPSGNDNQSGVPFEHKPFKLNSSFNRVGPFQLESMFYSIEQDLHRQKYREPKKKNPIKKKYKAVRSPKNNKDIIIKPADKGSAVVILDKHTLMKDRNNFITPNFMEKN